MSKIYYLGSTDSDLSGGADFDKKLIESTETADSIVVSVANQSTEVSHAYTDAGVLANVAWNGSGTTHTVEINVTTASASISARVRLTRLNSGGTVQESTGWSSSFLLNTTGQKSAQVSYTWGSTSSTDRLRVDYEFTSSNEHGGDASVEIGTGTNLTEVVTPFVFPPTVTTSSATNIQTTSVTGNGEVTSDGGGDITERGFVWSTTSNPTTSDDKTTVAGTVGVYDGSITGLSADTLYHYRAYAINPAGTSYGSDVTFTTLNNVPTIALDTADEANFSDNTPTLEFTGSDLDGDDLRYNIQIDTVDTFDSVGGSPNTIDSYSEANQDQSFGIFGTFDGVSQSFEGDGSTLGSVEFYLGDAVTPTGNVFAYIYSHTGTYGTDSEPNTLLATSDAVNTSTISTSGFALVSFSFSGAEQITLTSGTKYVAVLLYSGTSESGFRVGYDFSSPTHPGNAATRSQSDGTWTTRSGSDLIFYVKDNNSSGPLLDKLSGTDNGFENTVSQADTDPFNEGEKIGFTVQEADSLSNDTYYWRVKVKDPNGSDTYSDWATTRSFTIGEATGGTMTTNTDYWGT